MFEEIRLAFFKPQKTVSAQGLHQALGGSFPKIIGELVKALARLHNPVVKGNQFVSFIRIKRHIRITDE